MARLPYPEDSKESHPLPTWFIHQALSQAVGQTPAPIDPLSLMKTQEAKGKHRCGF